MSDESKFDDDFNEPDEAFDDDGFGNDQDFGGDDDGFGSDDDNAFGSDTEDHVSKPESKADFSVLSENEVKASLKDLTDDLAALLHVSPQMASFLLRCFKWNKEKITSQYLENPAGVLKEHGLQYLDKPEPACEEEIECPICDDSVSGIDSHTVGCPSHRFCFPCWRDYLEDKVQNSGNNVVLTHCPYHQCPIVVPDATFKRFLSPASYDKYQSFLLRSFVDDSRRLRWCPAPRCERVIATTTASLATVTCACGNKFCFKCNEEAHEPVDCDKLRAWLDKCRNESETAHWIIANTKKCPKCFIRIEKNQGCNHMTCRSCKHEFCWVCEGSWKEHGNHTGGFYKCNKFDPKVVLRGGNNSAADEAKAELNRYLHYYQRYHNHDQSKRFAEKQRLQTEKRMDALHQHSHQQPHAGSGDSWIDVQFLKAATEQVLECRRVLKYTYVFGYYLPDGPEKVLFEFLQQQLEMSTEHLSELSEQPIEKLNRADVTNYTRVTARFMNNLLEGVEQGLTGDMGEDTVFASTDSFSTPSDPAPSVAPESSALSSSSIPPIIQASSTPATASSASASSSAVSPPTSPPASASSPLLASSSSTASAASKPSSSSTASSSSGRGFFKSLWR